MDQTCSLSLQSLKALIHTGSEHCSEGPEQHLQIREIGIFQTEHRMQEKNADTMGNLSGAKNLQIRERIPDVVAENSRVENTTAVGREEHHSV